MNEPPRLLEGEATDLERMLLAAHDAVEPPRKTVERTLVATGLASGLVGMTGTTAVAATKVGALGAAKWLATIVVTCGVAAIVARRAAQVPSDPRSVVAAESPAAVALPAPSPAIADAPQADPIPSAPPTTEAVTSTSPRSGVRATLSAQVPAANQSLSAQVAALDAARHALASHDTAGALAMLSRFGREYPKSILLPEATILRIEALAQAGDRKGASALANRFLSANPNSPQAARVHAIVDGPSRQAQ
jgi:hypothetical protein